ncbi:E3 ubiquitin/ISG15 ligase TRIM25-like [Myxocyprinus asiaticus]|uniref:E3 ubiquitin/ISG15 ligase TRIM25-like n=1 Tax=Myxocyprinus asiaticus TaxID=70543 RepID=UPI0022233AB4|nr:E3 ubiquitin/ISG15 ligase TRIM25-like [Myxocyprinus asiaticus]
MAEAVLGDHERYNCLICLDLLKDPVTIPCGHSYCMSCISECWNMEDQRGPYSCPQCRHAFYSRPSLNRSTVLAEIMEKLRDTTLQVSESAQSLAGPGDIGCDFCTGRKFKAVKSCLECLASYCETHVHPHYNVPALKKHKLVKAAIMPTCSKHDKLLEVYCRTDQKCVCMHCLMDDHKGHDTVPCMIERNEKQSKLADNKTKLKQTIQGKEKELLRMKTDINSHSCSAKKAVQNSKRAFTELVRFIEMRSTEVIEKIKAQEKADLYQGAKLQKNLEVNITELKKREEVLETLLQTDDNIYFLQNYESMSSSSGSDDFPSPSFKPCCSYMDLSKLVYELKERLETVFNQEISETSKKVSDLVTKNTPVCIKVGDRVRVKPSVHTPKYEWGRNVTHETVGLVKDIKGDDCLVVEFPGHTNWRGILSEMELVTDVDDCDPSSIKIGSRVCVKASVDTPECGWGDVTKNSVGILKAVDGETVTVDFPEYSDWTGILSEMELAHSDETGSSTLDCLEIGNRVRVRSSVTNPKHGWGEVTHSCIGVIKQIQGEYLTVDFPEQIGWIGIISEMELVTSAGSELGLSPGERVHVKPSISTPAHGWGSVTKDSVGVVLAIDGTKVTVNFPEQSNWTGIVSEMEAAPNDDTQDEGACSFNYIH